MYKRLALTVMLTACATASQPQPQPEITNEATTNEPASNESSIPVLGLELGLPERPMFVVPNLPPLGDDGTWSIRGLRSVRDELLNESEQGRVVIVTAYVQSIYQPPSCLDNQRCLPGKQRHAWLVDDPSVEGKRLALMLVGTEFPIPEWDAPMRDRFADAPRLELEVGRRYAFMGWFRRHTESGFVHDHGLLELFATTEVPVHGDSEWVVPIASEYHPRMRALMGLEPLQPELAHVPDAARLQAVDPDLVLEPPDVDRAYVLGRDADVAGQPLFADYYFRWSIVHSPESPHGWVALANFYADYGEGEAGEKILEIAIERQPDEPRLHNGMGRLLLALERPGAASAAYRRAIELVPTYTDALFGLGMAYAEQGDRQRAIEALERFLELARDAPEHVRAAARDTILRMRA
jgi:hypothetical protein